MIRKRTVYEVECDRCGRELCDETDGHPWNWATPEAAVADLPGCAWVHIGNRDLCELCVGVEACELFGHPWGNWRPVETLLYSGLGRCCEQCGVTELDPPAVLPDCLFPSHSDETEA